MKKGSWSANPVQLGLSLSICIRETARNVKVEPPARVEPKEPVLPPVTESKWQIG